MGTRVVVTGGSGFIGAHLVKRLVHDGWDVVVVDNLLRGDPRRLAEVADQVALFDCDVRDEESLTRAFAGAEVVMHLAAVNGTENFYKHPELVLDVGLRGALAVVNAGRAADVPDLIVASSAEVYQTPSIVPTPETAALTLPDSLNPRFSYGGSKIASELIAFNYAQDHYRKVQVFRPHNVYGPDMGWKHVIPQFIERAFVGGASTVPFEIQGTGEETRAFCFVDDIVAGILLMYQNGGHRQIYHIGNDEEVTILALAHRVAELLKKTFDINFTEASVGGTPRRCPDITKMRQLGYQPQIFLEEGLRRTIAWYSTNQKVPAISELL
jgi:UDP-glucose 4-epimerase